jgi:hypothetical protein
VGLAGDHVKMIVIETAHSGIVPEHRHDPRLLLRQRHGGLFDAGLEQGVDCLFGALRHIPVPEHALKGVVVAVVAAGLGNIFQFDVGGLGETHFGAAGHHFRIEEVLPDGGHIFGIKGKIALIADAHKGVVTVDGHSGHRGGVIEKHFGDDDADAGFRIPIRGAEYLPLLDNVIGQQLGRDAIDIVPAEQVAPDTIPLGGIDALPWFKIDSQQVFHGLHSCGAGIVTDSRAVADPDHPVKIDGQRLEGGDLGDRVGEDVGLGFGDLLFRQIGIDGDNMNGANLVRCDAEIVLGFGLQALALGIDQLRR